MFRTDLLAEFVEFKIVEIFEVAGRDTYGPDAQPRLHRVDAIEIDQTLQRGAKRRGVVITARLWSARWPQRCRRNSRPEKTGNAERRDQGRAGFIEQGTAAVAG